MESPSRAAPIPQPSAANPMGIKNRYAKITGKFPREFLLLQGTGCAWRQCRYCDYYDDVSAAPAAVNLPELARVTGELGALDVINSGSAPELDPETLAALAAVVREKRIHTLWFEAHWRYCDELADFARRFAPVAVKFRCGVETFDPRLRVWMRKGIPADVTPQDVARYFQGVCLLVGFKGEDRATILEDIRVARENFGHFVVNLFCDNRTEVKRDPELAAWFAREVAPGLRADPRAEVLLDNTDFGVG